MAFTKQRAENTGNTEKPAAHKKDNGIIRDTSPMEFVMSQPPFPDLPLLTYSDYLLRAFTPLACSRTNLRADSLYQVSVGCDVMWSMAQQFACMRITKCNTFEASGQIHQFL